LATHEKEIVNGPKACVVAVVVDETCYAVEYMTAVKCRPRFDARFRTLAQVGKLRNPDYMRKLEGEVWEIKVDQGPGRRIYGCWQGRVFVLTHGSDKPKKVAGEVRRAERIFAGWKSKEAGGQK